MSVKVDKLNEETLADSAAIWNDIVRDGLAFPQTETLSLEEARTFFSAQSYTGSAVDTDSGSVVDMYVLHPNDVGRCGRICNAGYAVKKDVRGLHLGEHLVKDSICRARELGFRILRFNAVAASNERALKLYKRLGFTQLGVIPGGFRNIDGVYEDIIPHYIVL